MDSNLKTLDTRLICFVMLYFLWSMRASTVNSNAHDASARCPRYDCPPIRRLPHCDISRHILILWCRHCYRLAYVETFLFLSSRCCFRCLTCPHDLYSFCLLQHKNHTGHNATKKDHRRGIKKMPNFRFKSTKGVSHTTWGLQFWRMVSQDCRSFSVFLIAACY